MIPVKLHALDKYKCGRIKRLLSESMDSALTPRQQKRLDNHLAHCADCAESASFYNDLRDWAKTSDKRQAPDYLWERINIRLDEHPWGNDDPVPENKPGFWSGINPTWRFNLSGALIACLTIFLFGLMSHPRAVPTFYTPADPEQIVEYSSSVNYLSLYMMLRNDTFSDEMRDFYLNQLSALEQNIRMIEETRQRYPQNRRVQAELASAYEKKFMIYCQLGFGAKVVKSRHVPSADTPLGGVFNE